MVTKHTINLVGYSISAIDLEEKLPNYEFEFIGTRKLAVTHEIYFVKKERKNLKRVIPEDFTYYI